MSPIPCENENHPFTRQSLIDPPISRFTVADQLLWGIHIILSHIILSRGDLLRRQNHSRQNDRTSFGDGA